MLGQKHDVKGGENGHAGGCTWHLRKQRAMKVGLFVCLKACAAGTPEERKWERSCCGGLESGDETAKGLPVAVPRGEAQKLCLRGLELRRERRTGAWGTVGISV